MWGWGVVFAITAAGCVFLAQIDVALCFILIAVVSLAAVGAVAREYTERDREVTRVQRSGARR